VRIKAIRLAWFRGAGDPVTLTTEGKSMGIYGANGAGKSTFVDSVEYGIRDGKINHLISEYSGRNQEKAVRNTHTPANRGTELSIAFQDDSELNIKIEENGSHTRSGADGIKLQEWDYRRTVLRQDEVAEFVRSRKGEKYSALLPLFGLHDLEIAAENLRQVSKEIVRQSNVDHNRGALGLIEAKRRQAFGRDSVESIEAAVADLHKKYCPGTATTVGHERCVEVQTALHNRIRALTSDNQRHLALRAVAELDVPSVVKAIRDANARLADSVEPLIAEKLAVLQSADALAGQLETEDELRCPACGRPIAVNQFKAHLNSEQTRLSEIISFFDGRRRAIGTLVDALKSLKTNLAKTDLVEWRTESAKTVLKSHFDWLEKCDAESYRQTLHEDDLSAIELHAPPVIGAADEASRNMPPSVADLAKDQATADAAKTVFESQVLAAEIKRIEDIIAFVTSLEMGVRAEIRERAHAVITEISTEISAMWKALHPGEPIENVRLYQSKDDKAIDIALRFYGTEQDSPRLTLSEGYRNSLGLCIFLALAKREAGTDRPLILDDVVVSLDRNHRGMIVGLLETQFTDRQILLFTHDRDWYAELRHQLDPRRWNFKSLLPYETPELGIRWSSRTTSFDDARAHLKDRPDSAGNDARKIMDVELALIGEELQIKLPYRRGERNDLRIWSEFLNRLRADGKKCLQKMSGNDFPVYAAGLALLDDADRLLVSWGNRSSHSKDVERNEAVKLIDACEKALSVFICQGCKKPVWFADAGGAEWVQCRCGELRWRYGKA
jgi:hypothetical protein